MSLPHRPTAFAILFALGAAGQTSLHAETGVNDDRIVVGQSAAFSGPAQDFGNHYRAGIKLYFDQINQTGGIHGRRLELVSRDDAYDPQRTAENTVRLIEDDKVFALIGYVATGNLIAALPIAEKARVPMFAPMVGTTSFRTRQNRYLFHVRAGYERELRKIINHLYTLNIRDIAVVYQDSPFGKANLETALALAGEAKVNVLQSLPMDIKASSAQSQSQALRRLNAGAVVMIMAGSMVEVFIRDYRDGGNGAPLYTLSVGVTDAPALAKRLEGKLLGVVTASIVPSPQLTRFPIVADYQRSRAQWGQELDSYTVLEGYIVARVFVEGLKRTGANLSREGFINAMESMGRSSILDFPVEYGPKNHNGSAFVELEMYQRDGRLLR